MATSPTSDPSQPEDAVSDDADADERAAANVSDPPGAARALLHRERHAVLSTLSIHLAGYPYGSITPYALSRVGAPIILISSLAAHTKNLKADPRASLFVQERAVADDPQAGGRVTLMGKASPVPDDGVDDARARYLARLPQASTYFQTHDFSLWHLDVEQVRLIGGFGKICWLDGAALRRDLAQDPLAKVADGIIKHMNDDHADALLLYCRGLRGLAHVERAEMIGIDAYGFDVLGFPRTPSPSAEPTLPQRLRFDFPEELTTGDAVRKVVVKMAAEARQSLGK